MRRQVKPFVTEYRGNARRARDLSRDMSESGDQQTSARGRQSDGPRSLSIEPPDDSYEAAMRAADALFAPSPRRQDAPPTAPEFPTGSGVSMPPPASSPVSSDPLPLAENRTAKAEPPRRILQAIEPAGEDRFAALEAERAPKRRGRKPGSKNKPKIAVSDDWAAQAGPQAAAAAAPIEAVDDDIDPNDEAVVDDALGSLAGDTAMLPPRGRSDRFGWKRSGLRPGERWKRRLPKIAW